MTGTDATKQPLEPERSGRYLPTLDGWRAIAVLLVISYHGRGSLTASGLLTRGGLLDVISKHGMLGVDLFFGISGMLITSRLLDEQAAGRLSLRGFYTRRAFRILPLVIAFLAVLATCRVVGQRIASSAELLASLCFVRNYLPGRLTESSTSGWYTAHFWTLSIEEQFYLFWPLLLVALGRRHAPKAAAALAVLVTVWRTLDVTHNSLGMDPTLWGNRTDIRCDGLMWGCVAAFALASPSGRALLERWLKPWTVPLLGLLLVANEAYGAVPQQMSGRALLIPLLLLASVIHPDSLFCRPLEWLPVRWVGRLSYSIYVWQQLFFVADWSHQLLGGAWLLFPTRALSTLTVAVASHYAIERPLIRRGRRLAT